MELVYLWVEGYKNIGGKGFNFSSRYQCTGDRDNLRIIDKKEIDKSYIENFFSNNLNIIAIIGENGSGKSSIFEYIIDDSNFGSSFLIYEDEGQLYIKGDEYGIVESNISLELKRPYDNLTCAKINIDNSVNNGEHADNLDNLTIKTLKVLSKKNDVLKYFDQRFIFDKLIIEVKRDNMIEESSKYQLLKNLQNTITELIKQAVKEPNYKTKTTKYRKHQYSTNDIELDIKISFLIKYLQHVHDIANNNIDTNEKEAFIKENENYFDSLSFDNMFQLIKSFEEKSYELGIHARGSLKSIQSYENLISFFNKFDKKEFITRNEYSYELSKEFDIKEDLSDINYIINDFDMCYSDYSEFNCLEFKFYSYNGHVSLSELSSGEQSLIAKYIGIIYQILFSHVDILLIDEPDAFLHPKWAKEFLNNLINIITKDKLLKEKKLHLIITSHSPFILSDLPKENVIFLKDGKQDNPDIEQTFGANIHTLLSHGFFMDGGLMGEFAKGKINKVIALLKKEQLSKDEIKTCKQTISIIGEPILQQTLEHQLNEKINPNENELQKLEREQKEIQEKIDKLTKKKQ